MENALLSIVIPAYNCECYIKDSIHSVLDLTISSWQLIIVNDGSTDRTGEICKEFSENEERILYISQENLGVSAARNIGISYAKGEWVTFLDADDIISPTIADVLKNVEPSIDMIIAGVTRKKDGFVASNKCRYVTGLEVQKSILNVCQFKYENPSINVIDGFNRWSSCGKFFRKRLLDKGNVRFPNGIKLGEDLAFCMSCAKIAGRVMLNESYLYYYRENCGSVTNRFHPDRVKNTRKLVAEVKKHLISLEMMPFVYSFVINRIAKCCVDYYGDTRSGLSYMESSRQLREFCNEPLCHESIIKCKMQRLEIGKKNNLIDLIILALLKLRQYNLLIIYVRFLKKK